jgi:hypothetical protein
MKPCQVLGIASAAPKTVKFEGAVDLRVVSSRLARDINSSDSIDVIHFE